jgi:hypothetical protein
MTVSRACARASCGQLTRPQSLRSVGTARRVRELPTAGTALPRGQRPRPQAHAYGRPFGFQVVDHRTSLLATTSIAFQNRSQKTLYLIPKKRENGLSEGKQGF